MIVRLVTISVSRRVRTRESARAGDEREPSPLLLDSGLGKIEVIILRCSVAKANIKSEVLFTRASLLYFPRLREGS